MPDFLYKSFSLKSVIVKACFSGKEKAKQFAWLLDHKYLSIYAECYAAFGSTTRGWNDSACAIFQILE